MKVELEALDINKIIRLISLIKLFILSLKLWRIE